MVSMENILSLFVGIGSVFLLRVTFPELVGTIVGQGQQQFEQQRTDVDNVLKGIQRINLVLDNEKEIELKGLEVDRFDLLNVSSDGSEATDVTLRLISPTGEDVVLELIPNDEEEAVAVDVDVAQEVEEISESSPINIGSSSPIKKNQYYTRRSKQQDSTTTTTTSRKLGNNNNDYEQDDRDLGFSAKQGLDAIKKIGSLPKLIDDKIIDPVVDDIEDAFDDLTAIDNIADRVADGAVNVIKKINLFPAASALAKLLEDGMRKFIGKDYCVPYKCIIKKLGDIDISNIELYSGNGGDTSITTAVTPETCMEVTSIKFNQRKLQEFLNVFKNTIDLSKIYNKVKAWLQNQMDTLIDYVDDVAGLLEDVEDIVKGIKRSVGLGRRRRQLVLVTNTTEGNSTQPTTMEEASALAYEKGLGYFKELYGQEVKRVYEERQLMKNAIRYIGLNEFKVKVSQNFEQTLTMKTSKRTGYGDSIFDEALHQEQRIPVPYTANMVNVLVSGSLEGSLPYIVSMDAKAEATFGYNMGAFGAEVNLVTGKIDLFKENFKPIMDISAQVGVSGATTLSFAGSASLGICLGPDDDACLVLTLDAHQKAGVGFDALMGLNTKDKLTPMYAEELEYTNQKNCNNKQLKLAAGYWMYVKEPHVSLTISGNTCCAADSATLFEVGGGFLFKHTYQDCISTKLI